MTTFGANGIGCVRGGREVFRGLSFTLGAGDALVLGGPNGSGKSSLLRLAAGLIAPAAGEFLRGGAPVGDDPEGHRADLHYVGHQVALKPALTLARNLEIWSTLYSADEPAAVTRRALAELGLDHLADLPARILSAGQQRRAALCRLLLRPVSLWLLDEPEAGLDRQSRERLVRLIAAHREAGGMVIVATHHDLDLAAVTTIDLADFAPPADEGYPV